MSPQWENDDNKRKYDMEQEYRREKGRPSIEQEAEQHMKDMGMSKSHIKRAIDMRKKQGPGFWMGEIE